MIDQLIEFLLNTPEEYWLIIGDYHIHKSFWGLILFLVAGIFLIVYKSKWKGLILLIIGFIVLSFSIIGQRYTHGKYKLELWEKYTPKSITFNKSIN